MGPRLGLTGPAILLLLCSACGSSISSLENSSSESTVLVVPAQSPITADPYDEATGQLRTLAAEFVTQAAAYDSVRDQRTAFLTRVADLTTGPEQTRLATSARADFPWSILRARHERVELRITGISVDNEGASPQVFVEAKQTTHTDFATVSSFIHIQLTLIVTPAGWKVDGAQGAGL